MFTKNNPLLYSLIVLILSIIPFHTQASFTTSYWKSDFGNIKLQQVKKLISGSYPNYQGSIAATLDNDGALRGYWVQPSSGVKCKQPRQGSYHWGTLTFHNITTDQFTGEYAYCNQPAGSGGKWNGHFLRGKKPALPKNDIYALTKEIAAATIFDKYRLSFKHGNPVHVETDINCDGIKDFVYGWHETVNPDAGGYHISVVHQSAGKTQLTTTKLRVSGEQGGAKNHPELCKVPGHFKPELLTTEADKDIINHYKLPATCKSMVGIDDGACDKVYLMWNPDKQGEKQFIFFRLN